MKQINTFWNWFKKNEETIKNAIILGINTEEILFTFETKLNYVSTRIGYFIKLPTMNQDKYTIIFSARGFRKLYPKIIAFENQAPPLNYFIAQAFIKPLQDKTAYQDGTDSPRVFKNFEIKVSELQIALMDYKLETKQLKIQLYVPHYDELKQFQDLDSYLELIVQQIIGEIAFRKHIKQIQYTQMPIATPGLLNLIDLQDYIDYLYKINSRKKTRLI